MKLCSWFNDCPFAPYLMTKRICTRRNHRQVSSANTDKQVERFYEDKTECRQEEFESSCQSTSCDHRESRNRTKMVEQIDGKNFQLDLASMKNWEAYLGARGTSEELRKLASKYPVILTYTLAGDEYAIKTAVPGSTHESTQKFKIGVETEITTRDGFKVKSTWARDGNKLIETQRGESKTFVVTHDFSAAATGTITISFAAGNVIATQTYKAV